jgi:hypothetical protein
MEKSKFSETRSSRFTSTATQTCRYIQCSKPTYSAHIEPFNRTCCENELDQCIFATSAKTRVAY